jgi:hypothetical protein
MIQKPCLPTKVLSLDSKLSKMRIAACNYEVASFDAKYASTAPSSGSTVSR